MLRVEQYTGRRLVNTFLLDSRDGSLALCTTPITLHQLSMAAADKGTYLVPCSFAFHRIVSVENNMVADACEDKSWADADLSASVPDTKDPTCNGSNMVAAEVEMFGFAVLLLDLPEDGCS